MKQVYGNITRATGPHIAGLCSVQMAAKEWLILSPSVNWKTLTVNSAIALNPGREFIKLEVIENTFLFREDAKTGKSGNYFDISISFLNNTLDKDSLQILMSSINHEWVVITEDRLQRKKIIGNKDAAMEFSFRNEEKNEGGGKQTISISLTMQSERPALFYLP